MNPKITYAITVCNEAWELDNLLQKVIKFAQPTDQILIQSDSDNVTEDVGAVIDKFIQHYRSSPVEIQYISTSLDGDFSKFKNNLKLNATGDWIFQLDADEYPTDSLFTSLLYVLKNNEHVDAILVPRINTVNGITQAHITEWGWKYSFVYHPLLQTTANVSGMDNDALQFLRESGAVYEDDGATIYYNQPVINFPDYQWRLYKNKPNIQWINKVHERLIGFDSYATLPADISWCIMHEKEIQRQEYQNKFYDEIIKT